MLNSFQFRLYSIVLLLVLLPGLTIGLGLRAIGNLVARDDTLNAAAQQRSDTYLLAGLARRLATATDDAQRDSLAALMRDTMANFDRLSAAMLYGDAEPGIVPVDSANVRALVEATDLNWQTYRQTLNDYMDGILSGAVEAVWLLDSIDTQSGFVYSYADQTFDAISELTEQEEQALRELYVIVIVLAVFFAVLSILVVFRSVQGINRLAATAAAFARGDLNARAPTDTVNEIARVGEVFNRMSDEVAHLIEQLQHQVTEAVEARESAERSDRVKSAFLASMSHELRTPLNSVINYTRFVIKGVMGEVNEKQVETLNKVVDSGKHLLSLINDVLDISKIESGSLSLFLEDSVNVGDLVRSSVATTGALLENKPVKLHVTIEDPLPLIQADRQRVRQVLLNILSNACKFTQAGQIQVRAWAKADRLTISIQDSGPGIAPEDFPSVFEAFKQTETGLRQGGGTGLGMPISRSLVEAHGGRLWFESEIGKGTTFYIALPVKTEQPVPVVAQADDRMVDAV